MRYQSIVWIVTLTTVLIVLSGTNFAATVTFDGGGHGRDWSTSANWVGDSEPSASDQAEIVLGHTVDIALTGETAKAVVVNGGSTLNVDLGDLTYGNGRMTIGQNSPGTVFHRSGSVTSISGGDLTIGRSGQYALSGGALNVDGDVVIAGGIFDLTGAPSIDVRGDFRFIGNPPGLLGVHLTGDTAPTINVGGELRLDSRVRLEMVATEWEGESTVSLFDATGGVRGAFDSVLLNGRLVDAYRIESNGFTIDVPEPSASYLGRGAAFCVVLIVCVGQLEV